LDPEAVLKLKVFDRLFFLGEGGGGKNTKTLIVVKRPQAKLPDYRLDIKISFTDFSICSIGQIFFVKAGAPASGSVRKYKAGAGTMGHRCLSEVTYLRLPGTIGGNLPGTMGGNLPSGWGIHHTVNDDMGHMDTLKK
jgi:hypothetical protein